MKHSSAKIIGGFIVLGLSAWGSLPPQPGTINYVEGQASIGGQTLGENSEAVEMAMRAAMHQAGAAALSQLLRCEPPGREQREIPCSCGQKARYREKIGRAHV